MLQKISVKYMLFFWAIFKNPDKKKKKKKSWVSCIIDNKKHFFLAQISILKWFLKDHVTLNIRVFAEENSALRHRKKLHFKTLQQEIFHFF